MAAPMAAGALEKALTGEDTGIASRTAGAAIGVRYGLPAAKEAGKFIAHQGGRAGVGIANATLGKEFIRAARKEAAGEVLDAKAKKALAGKLAKWASKTAARQGLAATAGGWSMGVANIAMAAWSVLDLVDIGKSLITGDWD